MPPVSSPPHPASQHEAVVGRCRPAGRLAAQGVETELEARVVRHRRGKPPADAPVARPAVRHPEADVGRAREASARERQAVARFRLEAPCRVEPAARCDLLRALRPPQPVGCEPGFAQARAASAVRCDFAAAVSPRSPTGRLWLFQPSRDGLDNVVAMALKALFFEAVLGDPDRARGGADLPLVGYVADEVSKICDL